MQLPCTLSWAGRIRARCCRLARCCPIVSIVALPVLLTAQATETNVAVQFRLRDQYLIVVQTVVNGEGPFPFVLDTGTSRTIVDPALAAKLHAPIVGNTSLSGMLRVREDKLVEIENIRLGAVSLSDMTAVVDKLSRQKMLAPGIRGVLGEDFLSRFDLLIDYKHRRLRFGGAIPVGERCRFETSGEYHGLPTTRRILIPVEFVEMNGLKVALQLDSGAKALELFPASVNSRSSPGWIRSISAENSVDGTAVLPNATIRIGTMLFHGEDVVQSHRVLRFDAGGLLPAAIFRSIYISHSGGFIVLNPVE